MHAQINERNANRKSRLARYQHTVPPALERWSSYRSKV